jgi:hypothetical protein
VDDLEACLAARSQLPFGFDRGVYRGLTAAYRTLGDPRRAQEMLAHAGLDSLDDPATPRVLGNISVDGLRGFRFGEKRLVREADGVYVAEGYDFANLAFIVAPKFVVAIDAGTTEESAREAVAALRRIADPRAHAADRPLHHGGHARPARRHGGAVRAQPGRRARGPALGRGPPRRLPAELAARHPGGRAALPRGPRHLRAAAVHRARRVLAGEREGIDAFTRAEWAAALDTMGGGGDAAFLCTVRRLEASGDKPLALQVAEMGLARYPQSAPLRECRQRVLTTLREIYSQTNPFRFIVYSEWAGRGLAPVAAPETRTSSQVSLH